MTNLEWISSNRIYSDEENSLLFNAVSSDASFNDKLNQIIKSLDLSSFQDLPKNENVVSLLRELLLSVKS